MKKEKVYKLLYIASALCLIGFIIRLIVDCYKYDISYSLPLYYIIVFRVIEFIIPSVILLIIGRQIKKKYN